MRKMLSALIAALLMQMHPSVAQTVQIGDKKGFLAEVTYDGTLPVTMAGGSKIFYDAFETSFDTVTNWNSPTSAGGGVAAAWSAGQITLGTGTTANGYSYVTTRHSWQPVPPGYLIYGKAINLGSSIPANTAAYWGFFTPAATPTVTTPISEGCDFEVQPGGKMYAACYAGSTRNVIQDLSVTGNGKQPLDGQTHFYYVFFRGDNYYFAIDSVSNIVAVQYNGANGPNINTQPAAVMAVAGTSTPLSSLTLTVPAVWIGDSGRNSFQISDQAHPWQGAAVSSAGALSVSPPDAVNFNNSTLANGTVVNGLFSSGTVTNPSTNQVVIGPFDTTGAGSIEFYVNITSGSGVSYAVQEGPTAAGPWMNTNGQVANNNQLGSTNSAQGALIFPVTQKFAQLTVTTGGTEVLSFQGYLRSSPYIPFLTPSGINAGARTALPGSPAGNGSTVNLTGDSSTRLVVLPYSIPELTWQYSTNGTAITTNTTTTLQGAQAASVRNYLTGITCDNSGTGAATELQILDGANVIFDGFIGAASATLNDPHWSVPFPVPLRGTAATAMSLKTITTGASLWCSAQGYAAY